MQVPRLVENNIKSITSFTLKQCHDIKFNYYCFLYNLAVLAFLILTVYLILRYKYNGNNKNALKKREDEKRDYILYNLRKYQNMKNKKITNIPIY